MQTGRFDFGERGNLHGSRAEMSPKEQGGVSIRHVSKDLCYGSRTAKHHGNLFARPLASCLLLRFCAEADTDPLGSTCTTLLLRELTGSPTKRQTSDFQISGPVFRPEPQAYPHQRRELALLLDALCRPLHEPKAQSSAHAARKRGVRGLLLLLCSYQSLEASLEVVVELLLLHRPCLDIEKCLFLDTIEKCKPHLQLWPSVACCRTRGGRSPASPPTSSTRPGVGSQS